MKTKTILLTAASVLASASLAWAQDNTPAPEAPAAPAAVAPALPPPSTPPVAPVPAVAPNPPTPAAPSAGVRMGGGGGISSGFSTGIAGGGGGGGGLTISSSSGGGGGAIKITRDGVIITRPTNGPDTTVDVVTSSTQDVVDEAAEPSEVNTGMMEEEGQLNLDAAIKRYQQTISKYDSRRTAVAQAVFRLGECYRKMGRMEEAKVQYARILREFPDQEALVKSSQTYLFGNGSRGQSGYKTRLQSIITRRPATVTRKGTVTIRDQSVSSADLAPEPGSAESADALEGNFDQDIALLNKQIAEAQQQVKLGVAPTATVDKLQRELLELQREKMTKTMEVNRQNLQRLAQTLKQSSEQQTYVTVDPTTGLPVTTGIALPDRELELMRRELARAQEEVFLRKRDLNEAIDKEQAVRIQKDKPEFLVPVLSEDAMYMKLKADLDTERLGGLSGKSSSESDKGLQTAFEHLYAYVNKICLPQLEAATQYAQRRVAATLERVDDLKKQIEQKDKAQADLQRVTRAVPKVEHSTDAFAPAPKPAEAYPAPEAK